MLNNNGDYQGKETRNRRSVTDDEKKTFGKPWPIYSSLGLDLTKSSLSSILVLTTGSKGGGSYLAGMAIAIPILNVDGRRHTNNFSKNI